MSAALVDIVGWGHTPFGRSDDTLETLITDAATQAIAHAEVDAKDIDAVFVGHFNAGMNDLTFTSGLVARALPPTRFRPAVRVENACASGTAAVHAAIDTILAGRASIALVVGVEKMTNSSSEDVGRALLSADYERAGGISISGFAELFAGVADEYTRRYGDPRDSMAAIAAKNHRNGADNPLAHFRRDLGWDFCRGGEGNPVVTPPLRRTDCAPITDGAAALVMTKADLLSRAHRSKVVGMGRAHDTIRWQDRDVLHFEGATIAWRNALNEAGTDLKGLQFAEIHDCFTIAELVLYEALGLTERGRGRIALDEGWVYPDGKLPINRSGGLKAKGHPIGATGVSQHVMSAMQLAGSAGGLQLPSPHRGAVFNMGGVAVANYATILESY